MRQWLLMLVSAAALAGCSYGCPSRPATTTVIVPRGATVICPDGSSAVLRDGAFRC